MMVAELYFVGSHEHLVVLIYFAEHLRGVPFFLFEDAVEIRDIVETAAIADFRDGSRGVDKLTGGMSETDVNHKTNCKMVG